MPPIFTFEAVDHVYITNLKFSGWLHKSHYALPSFVFNVYILVRANTSNLMLLECILENNKGMRLISATHSNITIAQSTIRDNYIGGESSGDMVIFNSYCNVIIINSAFTGNEGTLLICAREYDVAARVGRDSNTLTITGCEFRNNTNYDNIPGAIIFVQNSDVVIIDTNFIDNRGKNIIICISIISCLY